MLVAVVVLAVVTTALGVVVVALWLRARELESLLGAVHDVGSDLTRGHDAIVIEVRNHHELAARRSRLARGVSLVAPSLIRSLVHREALREVRAQLEEQGVVADVHVRRILDAADPRATAERGTADRGTADRGAAARRPATAEVPGPDAGTQEAAPAERVSPSTPGGADGPASPEPADPDGAPDRGGTDSPPP